MDMPNIYQTLSNPLASQDKSQHPTVVEYAVQEMMKRKGPKAAAQATAKRLSGSENLFLGPGVVEIDPSVLEQELWKRLIDFTINNMNRTRPGFEHYALDGTIQHFKQSAGTRAKLKALIIERLGQDPFTSETP